LILRLKLAVERECPHDTFLLNGCPNTVKVFFKSHVLARLKNTFWFAKIAGNG